MVSNIKKIQNAQFKVWDFLSYSSAQVSIFSAKRLLKTITYLTLIYALNIYSTTQAFATNYHISVTGRSSGDGSKSNPWDIVTALSGTKGAPGDTLWLHGGIYKGAFVSKLKGSSGANIVLAQFPGENAILDGAGQGRSSITLNIYGSYATYYGFQVMNSSSRRVSSQSGGSPSDLDISTGIHVDGPNNKLINLIVRDNVGVGIGFWKSAVNSELYGNIIYNNGWQGADRGHGPGIYSQNENTIKQIKDNVIFGGYGRGLQIYGVNGGLTGFNIDGNTFFNNGVLSAGTTAIIIGGESAADNITIKNNNTYKNASGTASKGFNIQVHYGNVTNGRLVFDNNNIVGGDLMLSVKDWKQIAFNGNNIVGKNGILTFAAPSGALGSYTWNNNNYHTSNTTNSMDGLTFDTWKKWYGLDANSRFSTSAPNNKVIIKPNYYKKGTGTVVVYNHQKLSSVDVDVSRIIPNGAEYEILDIENVTGQAIITGKYSGGTVRLPMNLTTAAKPNGVSSVPHSDQGFNVFLVRTKGNVTSSPVVATNKVPTLNAISSPAAINEDAGEQTVSISGISSGGESQTLTVTASSDNTSLIPNPSVVYSSPNSSGSLKFKPALNKSGTANITVTVNDGASSNNTISRTFKVTVNPVNDAPTINNLSNISIAGNSSTQTINLAGLSAGPSESQTIAVTASSSNTGLIPNPTVVYTSSNPTGSIKFAPAANKSGTATITVRVTDNGSGAAPNVNSITKTFTVTVGSIANKQPTLNVINTPAAINEDAPEQAINISGISAGDGESQKLTVTATSDNTGLIPNPSVIYTSPNATGSIKFKPAANKSGSANITVTVNDGASSNNTISRTFKVTVNPINDAPLLNAISNVTVSGNSSAQTISLAGISAGQFENQTLTLTATSSNTGLIPNPVVSYSSPNATGSLKFTPAANKSGTATITIKVTDNGSGTAPNKNTYTRTFTITVAPVATTVNKQPTLNAIGTPAALNEDAPERTINLAGISAGEGESQKITITAVSDNTGLIPNPSVSYTSPNATGSIKFKPVVNKSGSANITVTVNDGASSNNTITRTFKVTVNPINDAPTLNNVNNVTVAGNSSAQTISLAGISAGPGENQTLTVSAVSSNTGLIPNPTVSYSSPGATGSLKFTPAANKSGTATITVKVTDNGSGTAPHRNTISKTFTVTVGAVTNTNVTTAPPTINNISNFDEVLENSDFQTISLSGITAGTGDNKTLQVSATSSNTAIVPNPIIEYTAPNNKGILKFKPATNKTGSAIISVKVKNGSATKNLTTKTFKVNVVPVNKIPTIDALADLKIAVNANTQRVNLKGITAGAGESQNIKISVSSSNNALIPNPVVKYTNPQNSGTLEFKPVANKKGSSVITVKVSDNGPGSGSHRNTISRTFKVTVEEALTVDQTENNNVAKVEKLNLINAINNKVLFEITDGMTLYTSELPVKLYQLNIDAVVKGNFNGSVVFGFDGNQKYKIENITPYAIGGDERGVKFRKWNGLKPGTHTISATTYSDNKGEGSKGTTKKVTVTVIDDYKEIGSPFGDVISLHLINATNNNIIFELKDGMTIEVDDLPMALDQLNIRGITSNDKTGSVVFGFNGNSKYNVENVSPYVIGRNSGTDYFLWGDGLKMGVNTVTATTYSQSNGRGEAGKTYKIKFTIVNSKALNASSKITSKTGMNEPDEFKVQLSKFYPNPVQNQLSIQLVAPEDDIAQIYLNDVNGQLVKTYTSEIVKGENDLRIDTSEADSGVYIVTIVSTRNKINFKIVKD